MGDLGQSPALLVVVQHTVPGTCTCRVKNIKSAALLCSIGKSGTTFEKTPKNLSTGILESLDKQKNDNYIINIKRSKKNYTWLSFVEKLEEL